MRSARLFAALWLGLMAGSALAQAQAASGFYGGVQLRDREGVGSSTMFGSNPPSRTGVPGPSNATDDGQSALMFGGYRRNDLSVEAALNSRDILRLPSAGPGVGLALAEPATRAWNLDVFTAWEMRPSIALYGRLGYGQTEARPLAASASPVTVDPRTREGVNYGVGLRFDVSRSLGLRMEYSRFGWQSLSNLADALNTGMPESDQLSIGVQFRF